MKKHLEIAEEYVDFAAARGFSPEHVWRTIANWPHIHLTDNEKKYIKVLAEKKCPRTGWADIIRIGELFKFLENRKP